MVWKTLGQGKAVDIEHGKPFLYNHDIFQHVCTDGEFVTGRSFEDTPRYHKNAVIMLDLSEPVTLLEIGES